MRAVVVMRTISPARRPPEKGNRSRPDATFVGSCGRPGPPRRTVPFVELCRNVTVVDTVIAVGFAALDTGTTLVGASWWPHHPPALAWILLAAQAIACLSLALRRRYPLTVLGALTLFTLAVSLIIWPADLLKPAHTTNAWAPFSIALAAYCPLLVRRSRRVQYLAIGLPTCVVARLWQPDAVVIAIGLARTAIGPLLVLYFDARRRLLQAL